MLRKMPAPERNTAMKELAINRSLSDDTQKQSIWMPANGKIEVFALHITDNDEVIITDHSDYTKIYSVQSLDFFNALEQREVD